MNLNTKLEAPSWVFPSLLFLSYGYALFLHFLGDVFLYLGVFVVVAMGVMCITKPEEVRNR